MRIVLTRRETLDFPDGVSIFIVALSQALVELGHDVKIVVGHLHSLAKFRRFLSPRIELPIVALRRSPSRGPSSLTTWLRAKRLIDCYQPDLIVHSEAVPIRFRATTIHVVHDLERRRGPLAPAWRTIRRFAMRLSDHIVATTTELCDEVALDLGIPRDKVVLIPKCVDLEAYRAVPLQQRERAILHPGTLPYKDPAATIRAFGMLGDPSVTLYVTGHATAPVRDAVRALPESVRGSVKLLGDVEGALVRDLHGRVRVAAFPTRYTIPVASATVMESLAAETPIVGSPRLSRDLIVHRVNGLVAEPDPCLMAAAMNRLLNDDALWLQMSAGARTVARRFDARRVACEYIALTRKPRNGSAGKARTANQNGARFARTNR